MPQDCGIHVDGTFFQLNRQTSKVMGRALETLNLTENVTDA